MNIKSLKSAFAVPVPDRPSAYTPSLAITGLVISLLMTSCTTAKAPPTAFLPQKTISATGYGTVEKSDRYSRAQIKLMAMRASKMDAYRSLAEQLNGIQLRGQTTVGDMEVTHDNYQVYLNAYLRGARVKRTSAIGSDIYAGDDTFETIVELDLTPRFYECINGPSELINQCFQQNIESPAPSVEYTPPKVSSINSGYSYPNTKGFNHK
ncbi:MAG: LPP20 family lipoprotein [Methylobacter sp.]|uniref:LPP20 family lipoprotein n=1 Tax=Methylobacter sp. TaxID=2051955 RepID=UPI0027318B8F|nr:LPP20 family lipoprotein [Methylobacter sp.]MDP1663716.1 LPP20 family lipoprotein [Methylobacter sp.]